LNEADAIVFGSPTYMGMVSGPFKCFADATAPMWFQMSWKDKIAGGFTSSGYASGDKVMTLHYMATLAAQLRMIWVGPAAPPSNITQDGQDIDRWGYYIGVGAIGSMQPELDLPDAGDLKTATYYGVRLATVTKQWSQAKLNQPSI
ncbi:MAG: flavodoxin family protein, partial [Chloroflexota bacterium]